MKLYDQILKSIQAKRTPFPLREYYNFMYRRWIQDKQIHGHIDNNISNKYISYIP